MKSFSAQAVLGDLDGCEFIHYRDLEAAILTAFNTHLADFPPHYSYLQFLTWSAEQGWIVPYKRGWRITTSERTRPCVS